MVEQGTELAALSLIEGDWHGEGEGPYGPYWIEVSVERRGRWLLLTSSTTAVGGGEVYYYSTQVFGHGARGLTLHMFDTAGEFHFTESQSGEGATFDWAGDGMWKKSEYWRAGWRRCGLPLPVNGARQWRQAFRL